MPVSLSRERLVEILDAALGKRVVIAGDAMLDVYLHGNIERISPEAPVPVCARERCDALGGLQQSKQQLRESGA
jgi:bifunctional ADP-heptose synthase (sugar kinase/adenylyltransferase)